MAHSHNGCRMHFSRVLCVVRSGPARSATACRNGLRLLSTYSNMVNSLPRKAVGLEEISEKARIAARAVNDLISSMALAVEEKVSLQHQINSLARESEYMIDSIDGIAKGNQKKVLMAYREFLKGTLQAVDKRLKSLE